MAVQRRHHFGIVAYDAVIDGFEDRGFGVLVDCDDDTGAAVEQPYYKVRIALTNVDLHNVPGGFRLIPGMTLTADVHIGTRSVFMYVVNGAVQGMNEAMREP